MKHNVKAPSVGESITEVSILKWAKQNGQQVKTGDLLLEIESDKATVEIVAEATGALQILKEAGERIPVGELIGVIDDSVTGTAGASAPAAAPKPAAAAPAPTAAPAAASFPPGTNTHMSPAVQKMVTEGGYDINQIQGTGKHGLVTKGDVQAYAAGRRSPVAPTGYTAPAAQAAPARPGERRVKMSMLRQKIAERLVHAQHTAAILTTFNEVDMGPVMELRAKHKDAFKAKHGVSLGFMSFFTRASVEALKLVPEVNAFIEGNEIVYHDFFDVGIAVGTDRGLVVPVLRDAGKMGFADIEKKIGEMAVKAKESKLTMAELSGGTFTISNGGVYGSLLSTPILNPPQSGILGMHKIMERAMVIDGKIVARPMMYLALSYDHRIIDGKGAVTFLVHLKDFLEHPEKLNFTY